MNEDIKYMRRCLELALMGRTHVSPNPMVGAVVVHNGKIIGEGYHAQYGKAHAEVNAIDSVRDKSLLPEATVYVSLEPCAHFGKTPPCASLLASIPVKRVVIGVVDSFSKVAGKGIEVLKNAGIDVTVGVLENECRELNRNFFTLHEQRRPYIILKWAQSLDGFLDIYRPKDAPREPHWITNKLSRRLVHKWRAEEPSIMIGTNTALKDNPRLDVRDWKGKNPTRIVLDRVGRLPLDLHFFDQNSPTVVFTECERASKPNLTYIKVEEDINVLDKSLKYLYDQGIASLLVEGGNELLNSFIKRNLWDESRVFVGNTLFFEGVKAPVISAFPVMEEWLEDTRLLVYRRMS